MDQQSPHIVRIAITGHRQIQIDRRLTDSIRQVFESILSNHPGADFLLYSALAEGSDQLVAEVAREYHQIQLVVPLPLPIEKYLMDFDTQVGRNNFDRLMKSAEKIIELPPQIDHQSAYRQLGKFLLDQTDLLIALWNGEDAEGKGGTGEVVFNALCAERPVHWIYCPKGEQQNRTNLMNEKSIGAIQVLSAGSSI